MRLPPQRSSARCSRGSGRGAGPDAPAQPAPEPTIAQGVKAGGVDLSGLTQEQAEALLTSSLAGALDQDFVVGAAGCRSR